MICGCYGLFCSLEFLRFFNQYCSNLLKNPMVRGLRGQYPYFMCFCFVFIVFCSNVFLYVSTGYTSSFRDWMQPYLEIQAFVLSSYLPFMFCDCFVVHLKSYKIFSAIATDDRHPLWSSSIHQNAANCKDDSAHAHVIPCDPLPVVMGTFSAVETVLRHGRMFQGSEEV